MKKILLVVLTVLVALSLVAGCSATSESQTGYNGGKDYYAEGEMAEAPAAEEPAEAPAPAYDEGYGDSATESAVPQEEEGAGTGLNLENSVLEPSVNRKIIYEGYIESRTKKFDEDYNAILTNLQAVGGYVENSSIKGTKPENWQDDGRYASMTLRVPSAKFDAFMNMLKGLGQTVSTSVTGTDISLQYFDVETRLETLRIRETRLQDLLKEAKGLEDIIELERELGNVSEEIRRLETQKRDYDSLIDFSTVTIYLQEANEVQSVTPSEEPLGNRITTAFYAVLNALAKFGEGLLIFFVGGSPILIPLAVIAVVVILLVRRNKKKKAARNSGTPVQ